MDVADPVIAAALGGPVTAYVAVEGRLLRFPLPSGERASRALAGAG